MDHRAGYSSSKIEMSGTGNFSTSQQEDLRTEIDGMDIPFGDLEKDVTASSVKITLKQDCQASVDSDWLSATFFNQLNIHLKRARETFALFFIPDFFPGNSGIVADANLSVFVRCSLSSSIFVRLAAEINIHVPGSLRSRIFWGLPVSCFLLSPVSDHLLPLECSDTHLFY